MERSTQPQVIGAALLIVLAVATLMTIAPMATAAKPPGKLAWKFNIIGVPRDTAAPGAEAGSGGRIFIPLVTTWYRDPCSTTNEWNQGSIPTLAPDKGVKIKVSEGPFDIVDGDAVADKVAAFTMPVSQYDIYIVAKGKPGGCLDLEAYTYETVEGVVTLIPIGHVDIDRTTGKPKWQNINFLLYGPYGPWFADPYFDYFWQLYNNGLRNMEVRFYIPPPPS